MPRRDVADVVVYCPAVLLCAIWQALPLPPGGAHEHTAMGDVGFTFFWSRLKFRLHDASGQVVKAMGLGRAPVPSPEEAYAQAQAALESLSLPLALDKGATITECVPCVALQYAFPARS